MFTEQGHRSRPDHDAPRNHFWLAVTVWVAVLLTTVLALAFRAASPQHAPSTGAQRLGRPARSATTPTPPGPASPGWQTVWTAGFAGPDGSPVSSRAWKFDTGTGIFGTREVETMTDSTANVHADGQGGLDITVLGHGAAGTANAGWTSGRIQTKRLFTPPPGKEILVTASIQQPDPRHGDGTFGPCREGYGLGSGMLPCPGCEGTFRTYSVIIDRRNEARQQIRWYLDGSEFYSVSESQVGRAAWTEAVDHGFSIILDVAVGGSYPDIVCQCVSPDAQTSSGATMTVRWLAMSVR